jgi:membrane protease YdiL (CAAX protease family)
VAARKAVDHSPRTGTRGLVDSLNGQSSSDTGKSGTGKSGTGKSDTVSTGRTRRYTNRRRVVGVAGLTATGLLGTSLSVEPGSAKFYRLTMAAAASYAFGGLISGPIPLERAGSDSASRRRSVFSAVLVGAATFVVFYLIALVARHIPILNKAIGSILGYAHHGAMPLVVMSTLTTGAAEEIYFRGAVYGAVRDGESLRPVAVSTTIYALATVATRNPALVLASIVMGALFALQRRSSEGVLAPTVTHLVWGSLMLRYLPPLFPPQGDEVNGQTV